MVRLVGRSGPEVGRDHVEHPLRGRHRDGALPGRVLVARDVLKARVAEPFDTERRVGVALVVVARKHAVRVVEGREALQAVPVRARIAPREVEPAGAVLRQEQEVPRQQIGTGAQRQAVGRVAGGVEHLDLDAPHLELVAIAEAFVHAVALGGLVERVRRPAALRHDTAAAVVMIMS